MFAILSCGGGQPFRQLEEVRVIAVRDGDTIELDDGRIVRYVGINTPERGQPGADSATALNRRLVLNKMVRLDYGHDRTDRYGRTLAHVYVDGMSVNRAIVEAGWAWCYFFFGNLTHGGELVRALQDAMVHHRGIWKEPHAETEETYIGSFLAHRFHRPDCRSVKDIKRPNEILFIAKDSAFFYGYSPCGSCRP